MSVRPPSNLYYRVYFIKINTIVQIEGGGTDICHTLYSLSDSVIESS